MLAKSVMASSCSVSVAMGVVELGHPRAVYSAVYTGEARTGGERQQRRRRWEERDRARAPPNDVTERMVEVMVVRRSNIKGQEKAQIASLDPKR